MHSLLHASLAVVFQVQDILGMPSKRNRILDDKDIAHESDNEKEETEKDKHWTDSMWP